MTTTTIRQVQHNLARFLREVEAGGEVEIRRRNRPIARIVPVRRAAEDAADWSGHAKAIAGVFRGRRVAGTPMETIVSEGRGDR